MTAEEKLREIVKIVLEAYCTIPVQNRVDSPFFGVVLAIYAVLREDEEA
jgi:hypothetical protein